MIKVEFNLDFNKVLGDLRKARQTGEPYAEVVLPANYKARIEEVWEVYCEANKNMLLHPLFGIREALKKHSYKPVSMYLTGIGISCIVNLNDIENEYAIWSQLEETFPIPIILLTQYDTIMKFRR